MGFKLQGKDGQEQAFPGAFVDQTLSIQLTASANDFAPSYGTTNIFNVNAVALNVMTDLSITGIAGGREGRVLKIVNVGAGTLTLPANDAGSVAANRFAAAATVAPGTAILLQYSGELGKWATVGSSAAGGGVQSVVAGSGITVDATDPENPIVATTGIGSGFSYIRAAVARALTDTVAAQKLFNNPAAGALTLATGTYQFDCMILLSAMSATSGNGHFNLLGAGTATLGLQLFDITGVDGSIGTPATKSGVSVSLGNQDGGVDDLVPSTNTVMCCRVKGTFAVTVAGTIIPSYLLTTGGVTPNLIEGTYFACQRVGAHDLISVGNWS